MEQYDQAIQATKAMQDKTSNKADTFAKIALKTAQAGKYDQALRVTKLIEYPEIRANALADVAVEYAKAGQKAKAQQILAQALQRTKAEDGSSYALEVAVKYAQVGQKAKAEQILAQALESTKAPSDYYPADINANALAGVALKYAQVGQQDKAEQVFAQALQLATTLDNHKPDKWYSPKDWA